ncbi:hypothetical protein KUTeg_021029 [Tegillarca granosa]|uniref:Heme-binding protein 2 n=1 Tax=Tegillarca granosa TaxID=220873 RepID=A0ABQ9EDR2_TEGGR|nr:hypothetical protein KUTeg_021029 [Tegillarca granosa]
MKSLYLSLLVVIVGVVKADPLYFKPRVNQVGSKKLPNFCNGLECPQFKVVKKFKDYELREYRLSYWVSTNIVGVDYKTASKELFERLFKYISGANVKKQKIEMTAPVLTKIIPSQGPACESNFTMSFFVSMKNPPLPSSKDVFLSRLPRQRVYVRYFPGYHMSDIEYWIQEAIDLAKSIGDQSKYETKYYYIAGYDSPFRFLNRHNEIWFIANQDRARDTFMMNTKY